MRLAEERVGFRSRGLPTTPSSTSPAWDRADVVLVAVLFVVAASWFLWLASGASAQGVITGEEASITHRDALALRLGWQPSVWSTNVGAQFFYWAAGHLDPDYGLLYARKWKAVATALLSPLLYVVARRRLGCGRSAATAAAIAGVALPGVSMLAWVGIETPLDVVVGVAAVYVATSSRRWWWAGLGLAGLAVSFYTAGLASAVAVVTVALLRCRSGRDALLAGLGAAVGLGLVLAPLLWWRNGGVVVTGGGRAGAAWDQSGEHVLELARYAVDSGSSYYYFSDLPVLGGPVVAAILLAGVLLALRRWRRLWPWMLAMAASLCLYTISSGVPGSRRVVLAVVGVALCAAVGADVVGRTGARYLSVSRWAVPIAVAIGIVVPLVASTATWRSDVESGRRPLPIDWTFPVDSGGDQSSTLARLAAELRSGQLDVDQVGDGWGGTRTLAMLFMLDERAGRVPPLTPADILGYYRRSADCPPLDGPTCG